VRYVRAVMTTMAVTSDVMRHVFVYWSDMFARFVSWSISGRGVSGVVLN
jgi:hypothetical protein